MSARRIAPAGLMDDEPSETRIRFPHDWEPRPYQLPILKAMDGGKRRAVCVWHRRAGKDACALNFTAKSAAERVGLYWHMLPTATQARKVVWDAVARDGRRVIDQVFPEAARAAVNKNEMKIELVNGSVWQCVGSDSYNALVGANPVGVVFSEYSVADPLAWSYIRPILAENGGWAIFIFTPRGRNHGYDLFRMAEREEDWFSQILTVQETGVLSADDIADERRSGMAEAMVQQEYYCSFTASLEGAIYGALMDEAHTARRIARVPYDSAAGVVTAWDLGYGDSTAIWFAQVVGREIHLIDYYEANREALPHYFDILRGKPYSYVTHYGPHDLEAKELGTGKSRREIAEAHGFRFEIAPKLSVEDGIEAVRALLGRAWFDGERCDRGIEALKSYRRHFNTKTKAYEGPVHDWASHGADAMRYLALSIDREPFHRPGASSPMSPINYPELPIV